MFTLADSAHSLAADGNAGNVWPRDGVGDFPLGHEVRLLCHLLLFRCSLFRARMVGRKSGEQMVGLASGGGPVFLVWERVGPR